MRKFKTPGFLKSESLTGIGLIFGESAKAGSRNVLGRLQALERICPFSQGLAVDLGCGQGGYTIELEKYFARVLATDVLPMNVEYARKHVSGNVEFCCGALEYTPVRSDSVDAAFLIEVLDHVNDVELSLSEVWRILKPRSRAYISVPNSRFPFETHPVKVFGTLLHPSLFPFLNWTPFHDRMATARIFGKTKLMQTCESLGFHVVGSDYVVVPLERRLKFLRPLLAGVAKTPLKPFVGVSLAVVLEKPNNVPVY